MSTMEYQARRWILLNQKFSLLIVHQFFQLDYQIPWFQNNSIGVTIHNIEKTIFEVLGAYKIKHKYFKYLIFFSTSWDDRALKEWNEITLPFKGSLLMNGLSKVNKKDIKWEPPDISYGKFNFDGAIKGNPEVSRVG